MLYAREAVVLYAAVTITRTAAHGIVTGIVAGGLYYEGYNPTFQFETSPPQVAGWSIPDDISHGYIDPNNYTTPEIICHLAATPGAAYVTVTAGDTVELQWTAWPASHHGPVIDYLANCNGECSTVDKTTLLFNKIDGVGLINDASTPGIWAADQLIAANNSWTVTIPASVAPGNYVLRHEIVALHSAENQDGAQNYPQCVNLQIIGTGTDTLLSGTLGMELYSPSDPGVLVNIYTSLSTYIVPGPLLYSGASTISPSSAPIPSSTAYPAGYTTPAYGLQSISMPDPSNYPSPTSTSTTTASTALSTSSSVTTVFPSSSIADDACTVIYIYSTITVTDTFPTPSSLATASLTATTPTGSNLSAIPTMHTGTAGWNATGTVSPTSRPLPIHTHQLYEWLKVLLEGPSYTGTKQRLNTTRMHARDLRI